MINRITNTFGVLNVNKIR